jgi:hypothetical protein
MEEKKFEIPEYAKREVADIIADCPTIEKVGDHEYRVHRLRAYSFNLIMKELLDVKKEDDEIQTDRQLLYAVCNDIEKTSRIVAIILCNHLFKPDDIKDYESALEVMSNNEKLIKFMEARVLNSVLEPRQYASIVLSAIQSIDLSPLFFCISSAKNLINSLTTLPKIVEEQLRFFQSQAQGG